MHVLLRQNSSRLFYAGSNQWTANTIDARDFGTITKAESFAHLTRFADLEIVLRYDAPVCELTLPVTPITLRPLAQGV